MSRTQQTRRSARCRQSSLNAKGSRTAHGSDHRLTSLQPRRTNHGCRQRLPQRSVRPVAAVPTVGQLPPRCVQIHACFVAGPVQINHHPRSIWTRIRSAACAIHHAIAKGILHQLIGIHGIANHGMPDMAMDTDIAIRIQPLLPRNARHPFVEFTGAGAREPTNFHQDRGGQPTPNHDGRCFGQRPIQINPSSRRKAFGKAKFIKLVFQPVDQASAAWHRSNSPSIMPDLRVHPWPRSTMQRLALPVRPFLEAFGTLSSRRGPRTTPSQADSRRAGQHKLGGVFPIQHPAQAHDGHLSIPGEIDKDFANQLHDHGVNARTRESSAAPRQPRLGIQHRWPTQATCWRASIHWLLRQPRPSTCPQGRPCPAATSPAWAWARAPA